MILTLLAVAKLLVMEQLPEGWEFEMALFKVPNYQIEQVPEYQFHLEQNQNIY